MLFSIFKSISTSSTRVDDESICQHTKTTAHSVKQSTTCENTVTVSLHPRFTHLWQSAIIYYTNEPTICFLPINHIGQGQKDIDFAVLPCFSVRNWKNEVETSTVLNEKCLCTTWSWMHSCNLKELSVSRMHLMEMLHRMSSVSQPSIKRTVRHTVLSNDLMCSKWVVNYETNKSCTARPWEALSRALWVGDCLWTVHPYGTHIWCISCWFC